MPEYRVLEELRRTGIVAIVRGAAPEQMSRIADALYQGGVRLMEVTFNTPCAAESIQQLTKAYADKMIIGAGTVLDAPTARTAILSGAQFVLSPSLHVDVIRMCHKYNVLAVPGVFTPTEAVAAWELGVWVIKVFPAGVLGAAYIKQLMGPLDQLNIMVVGGIKAGNLPDFLRAKAMSAGIGSELVNQRLVDEGNYEEIYQRAKSFVGIVQDVVMEGNGDKK